MPPAPVMVDYLVCAGAAMHRIVRQGQALARPEDAHSVHVKVEGLEPGRDDWYRFAAGGAASSVGRTRTSSRADQTARLAVASCQARETGHYAAYADIAAWASDAVIHVGDYI